ncbi:Metallo-dependent phosphatase-like protein [Lasiosphaeria miniovina]|uniref:Metallo-dependent phosphatase-like protein n=1 Tax=Lasiosphaeria miniovina TaxID=1954250 RepID=A0AA39ZTY2_9PEZI|nr:Metallo-dependent phosphatase-like protein [Lasiosphaeria miniovina]KAK0703523.1 Metallo-dependent phosphatase-like protein [Lasiosphaeria miniovina]
MILRAAIFGSAIAALARTAKAAQPSAAEPVAAPMRDLRWGNLNFLHTTDTHGWHGGHLQESQFSADWGDYVSFAEHMRQTADAQGVDLLLVDTGDRVEGNGLYDASSPKGEYYYDIYREQQVDIICTGNHELYQASTADQEHLQTVPNFKSNYIASNLDYIDPESGNRIPMSQRYRKFQTRNQKLDIVAFGFLFDFTGNANNTVVQPVKETIREQWFQGAIREQTDLFVVIGHVGIQMRVFKDIFAAIRQQNPLTPILFFGGHVHIRDATAYDSNSFAIASGRYFETIGWMSVTGDLKRAANTPFSTDTGALSFQRRYIDNNLYGLYYHTGLNLSTFPTEHGRNVTAMIVKARKELDLDYSFGCAPKDYWMSRTPYPHEDSIYTWLEKEVLPAVAVRDNRKDIPRLVIMNTGAIRFDIFKGSFTRDSTHIVSPFLSVLNYIPDVPYRVARNVIRMINNAGPIASSLYDMDPRFMGPPEQFEIHEPIIYTKDNNNNDNGRNDREDEYGSQPAQKPLGGKERQQSEKKPTLVQGYTTRDDIGTDGDDAVHAPIDFYTVPNCIQAEVGFAPESPPETVDLLFFDFIQPWVLLALKYSGGSYTNEDVELYVDDTFTELMASWIEENWAEHCKA